MVFCFTPAHLSISIFFTWLKTCCLHHRPPVSSFRVWPAKRTNIRTAALFLFQNHNAPPPKKDVKRRTAQYSALNYITRYRWIETSQTDGGEKKRMAKPFFFSFFFCLCLTDERAVELSNYRSYVYYVCVLRVFYSTDCRSLLLLRSPSFSKLSGPLLRKKKTKKRWLHYR